MNKSQIIAIDGPAGSGKSAVARRVAEEIKFQYVDSGAIYRAFTFYFLEHGRQIELVADVESFLKGAELSLQPDGGETSYFMNGQDISENIRSIAVTRAVSQVSADIRIRKVVTQKLRFLGLARDSVVEGRDIGTVVFPDADIKIFMNANIDERAVRRHKDLLAAGNQIELEQVRSDIIKRDTFDSERAAGPLVMADDAVVLDTTGVSISRCVAFIVESAQKRHII